jgi:hypothetical protein
MSKGYTEGKVALGSNALAGATGFLEEGHWTYGYWTIKSPSFSYDSNRHKIYINFEVRDETTKNYPNLDPITTAGTVTDLNHLFMYSMYLYKGTTGVSADDVIKSYPTAAAINTAVDEGIIEVTPGYDTLSIFPRFELPHTTSNTWQKIGITMHLDKIAVENTSGYRLDGLSYINQSDGMRVRITLQSNPSGTYDFESSEDPAKTVWDGIFYDLDFEKPKYDYTPRSVGAYNNAISGEGVANDWIQFSEPKGVKKLQRGNFNIVIGTSPIEGLTPDGTFTSHTQLVYTNGAWDLEVHTVGDDAASGAFNFNAFESEAVYTFGADNNENFSDTNSIWFHDEVLISDWDNTTITNVNNCYLGDLIFRYAPPELASTATKEDYYYKIMDNFEDKTD